MDIYSPYYQPINPEGIVAMVTRNDTKYKLHFYEASVLTIFLYGSETWLIISRMESTIDSFGAACLRSILHRRRATVYHDRSEIYKKAGMPKLSKKVMERRLRWIGQLLRLNKGAS